MNHCLESTGGTRYLDFFSYPTSAYVRLLYTAANLLSARNGGVPQKEGGGVGAILEHLGLPMAGARLAPARGPHKAAWC